MLRTTMGIHSGEVEATLQEVYALRYIIWPKIGATPEKHAPS